MSRLLIQDGEQLPLITGQFIRQRRLYYRGHTDHTGRYEFRVGRGEYRLRIRGESPHGRESLQITAGGGQLVFDQHFEAPRSIPLTGRVVNNADGSPLAKATVSVSPIGDDLLPTRMLATTDGDGQFQLDRLRPDNVIYAHSEDGSLASFLIVRSRTRDVTLELFPSVTVSGQLLDSSGAPLANVEVAGHVRSPNIESQSVAIRTETDENGRYRIPGVAVGAQFRLVPMQRIYGGATHRNPVRIFNEPGEVEIEAFVVPRRAEATNPDRSEDQDSEASPQDGSASVNPRSVIDALAENCQSWINIPGEPLRSLQYTYTLGNDERQVELVRGVSEVRRGMWYGTTLGIRTALAVASSRAD